MRRIERLEKELKELIPNRNKHRNYKFCIKNTIIDLRYLRKLDRIERGEDRNGKN